MEAIRDEAMNELLDRARAVRRDDGGRIRWNTLAWVGFLFCAHNLHHVLTEDVVPGGKAASSVRVLAAYFKWLLMLVIVLMPVVFRRPPLVVMMAPVAEVIARARAAPRNVGGRVRNSAPTWVGFLSMVLSACNLHQALSEAASSVHVVFAAYLMLLLMLHIVPLMPVVLQRPPPVVLVEAALTLTCIVWFIMNMSKGFF